MTCKYIWRNKTVIKTPGVPYFICFDEYIFFFFYIENVRRLPAHPVVCLRITAQKWLKQFHKVHILSHVYMYPTSRNKEC